MRYHYFFTALKLFLAFTAGCTGFAGTFLFAGLVPFAFYNPFDVASGQQIGSNYDPTGNNTQGRVTVVFRGNWAQATDIARSNIQGFELVEVA